MLYAQKQRKMLMDKLRETFIEAAKKDLVIDEKGLLSEICMNQGSTLRKAKEYLNELLNIEFIERISQGLVLNKKYLPNETTIEGGLPSKNPLADSGRIPTRIDL